MPCYEIQSRMIFAESHFSTYRVPVHVYIHRRHKNGNLDSLFHQHFVFFRFFDHNNFPIRRSDDMTIMNCCFSFRMAKELKYDQKKEDRNHEQDNPHSRIGSKKLIADNVQCGKSKQRDEQGGISFFMYGHEKMNSIGE